MTPKQLQRFLDDAGMSQRGAAHELDIGERTMRRYIAGDLPVPRAIEFALRWLASQRPKEK
jgi:DNA transposition AAA+ family ATPase